MEFQVKEAIRNRRSVRSFDKTPLREEDKKALKAYIASHPNPFGVEVDFRILDAKKHGLSSPVIIGEDTYLAAKVKKVHNHEIAIGYSFEEACLFAQSLGLGTVMLAASLNRKAFEEAMEVGIDEVLPVASPLGYKGKKMSLRESLMRKALAADSRIPFEKLFYLDSYGNPLPHKLDDPFIEALDLTRLAPSAANRQPTRAIINGNAIHFYEEKSMKDSPLGDIQKVDVGIALAHFDLAMKANGLKGHFVELDPKIQVPENVRYIMTYERES